MGGTLISIAVAWGDAVIVAGVTDPSGEEQAVKMNNPINRIFGVLFIGMIGYQSNFNTYGWLLPFLQTRHKTTYVNRAFICRIWMRQEGSKSKETGPRGHWSLCNALTCKSFLLFWWLNPGRFIRHFRCDILFDLFELQFLLFLPFLFQFLLTLFVLIIYFSQFGILSYGWIE